MAKKGLFGKRKSTAAAAAQRMVLGGLPQEEEELMQSPARMVLQSFVHDKVAMTGLILFLIIFPVLYHPALLLSHPAVLPGT